MDTFLAIVARYRDIAPGSETLSYSLDFPHAYKHVPIVSSRREFATIVFLGPDGRPYSSLLRSQPFGSRRAPINWAHVAQFLKWVLEEFSNVVIAVYVDDIRGAEPLATAESAFATIKAVCALLGLVLDEKKDKPPGKTLELLGAQVAIGPDSIEASLPPRKVSELSADLDAIQKRGRLAPAAAAKLRGRLGFAQSLLFGRVGRAHLAPFSERQYSMAQDSRFPLNDELRNAIAWWENLLASPMPRRLMFDMPHPALVYTDACGTGHIGAIVYFRGRVFRSSTHLTAWLASNEKLITGYVKV